MQLQSSTILSGAVFKARTVLFQPLGCRRRTTVSVVVGEVIRDDPHHIRPRDVMMVDNNNKNNN